MDAVAENGETDSFPIVLQDADQELHALMVFAIVRTSITNRRKSSRSKVASAHSPPRRATSRGNNTCEGQSEYGCIPGDCSPGSISTKCFSDFLLLIVNFSTP